MRSILLLPLLLLLVGCDKKFEGTVMKKVLDSDPDLILIVKNNDGRIATIRIKDDDNAESLHKSIQVGYRVIGTKMYKDGASGYEIRGSNSGDLEVFAIEESPSTPEVTTGPSQERAVAPVVVRDAGVLEKLKEALEANVRLQVRILELEAQVKTLEAQRGTQASNSFLGKKPWDR